MNWFFRSIDWLARLCAFLGGMALFGIALVTFAAIVAREDGHLADLPFIGAFFASFNLPILTGEFEIVALATAVTICLFLPHAQLSHSHASVTFVTEKLNQRLKLFLDLIVQTAFLAVAALLLWRHFAGFLDKLIFPETTFILGLPKWWFYALINIGLSVWVLACVKNWLTFLAEFLTGRQLELSQSGEVKQ